MVRPSATFSSTSAPGGMGKLPSEPPTVTLPFDTETDGVAPPPANGAAGELLRGDDGPGEWVEPGVMIPPEHAVRPIPVRPSAAATATVRRRFIAVPFAGVCVQV